MVGTAETPGSQEVVFSTGRVMPKKKLLLILGAGSSQAVGMPSVDCINSLVMDWSREWRVFDGVPTYVNFYKHCSDSLEAYYSDAPDYLGFKPDFEQALGLLASLCHWIGPPPYATALRRVVAPNAAPPIQFGSVGGRMFVQAEPFITFAAQLNVQDQLLYLFCRLARHMRKVSMALDEQDERFIRYKLFLKALAGQFDLGIYTLNYDTAALAALPGTFTGFSAATIDGKRRFDPRGIHSRREWDFVYHLHGSVHHSLDDPAGGNNPMVEEVVWLDDLFTSFIDVVPNAGSFLDDHPEGKRLRPTTFVVGGHKLDQLLVEPFQSLHAALLRHVHEADAIIIGGYGFRDEHVDRALRSRMRCGATRPRVMVLTLTKDDEALLMSRYDDWSWRLMKPLDIGRHEFKPKCNELLSLRVLKEVSGFEVADRGAAVWHNGFADASNRLNCIVAWLEGADDEVLMPR
jgi:hypothetical protein